MMCKSSIASAILLLFLYFLYDFKYNERTDEIV